MPFAIRVAVGSTLSVRGEPSSGTRIRLGQTTLGRGEDDRATSTASGHCEHLLHGAAQIPCHDSTLAVAPEDREVRAELARDRRDALGGVSLLEPNVNLLSRQLGRLAFDALEVLIGLMARDLPAHRVGRARPRELVAGLLHVQQSQRAAERLAEADGIRQARLGELRAIQAHEHSTESVARSEQNLRGRAGRFAN